VLTKSTIWGHYGNTAIATLDHRPSRRYGSIAMVLGSLLAAALTMLGARAALAERR